MSKFLCFLMAAGVLIALCGCVKAEHGVSVPEYTELPVSETAAQTTPAETEPQPIFTLSEEQAMLDGHIVMRDGDVLHNQRNWDAFLEAKEAGNGAIVTVVQFTNRESRMDWIRYSLIYLNEKYSLVYETPYDSRSMDLSGQLVYTAGELGEDMEPYDRFIRYSIDDIVLYQDLIAEPDYLGVSEIHLHVKEGDPPIKSYTDAASVAGILELLTTAEYISCVPEDYLFGMKLLMTNGGGKEVVIELDLRQGVFRYGMQNYRYGEVSQLLAVLGLEDFPESVRIEFADYLDK